MLHTPSRRVSRYDAEAVTRRISALCHFIAPLKPAYWTTPVPRQVKYAYGDPHDIQQALASITDKSTLDKTMVILADPDDPKRPLFVITSLQSHFFPRGIWTAYLYRSKSFHSDDYRLIGDLTLVIEPYQIPPWLTWRYLARQLRASQPMSTKRKLYEPPGLLTPSLTTRPCVRKMASIDAPRLIRGQGKILPGSLTYGTADAPARPVSTRICEGTGLRDEVDLECLPWLSARRPLKGRRFQNQAEHHSGAPTAPLKRGRPSKQTD